MPPNFRLLVGSYILSIISIDFKYIYVIALFENVFAIKLNVEIVY